MPGYGGDLVGLIALLLTIWAIIGIVQSDVDGVNKIVWLLIVFVLPIIGFLIWYFIGPGRKDLPFRR